MVLDAKDMRVALITPYPPDNSGVASYAKMLSDSLEKRVGRLYIITFDRNDGVNDIWVDGGRIVVKVINENIYSVWSIIRILKLLDPDLIHFNIQLSIWSNNKLLNFLMSLTPFLIKVITRKKVIVTMHNIFEFVDRKGVKENYSLNPITKFFATIATWLYARADKLVMLTKRYEDYIRHRYCADFYHIPHGFMNLDGAEEKSSIYRNYRDGGEGFKIGFFGFFSPYKDPYLILEVYKLLKNKIPGLSLKFVGGPHPNFIESYNRIKNEVFNIGDGIQITGFLPFTDLYRELSDIDLFIFPYRAIGGVSGAVHLVASMGRPFILSDLPDFRYMVYENNMKTVFFNIDDVDDLANKILFLYENPSVMREIVNHNLRIAKDIDIDSVAEEYIKLYTSIV